MELIHKNTHDWSLGPRWTVKRHPAGTTDANLVWFVKQGQKRKLLDQVARWDGNGWDPKRWVPKYPKVPQTLLAIVEAHMRRRGDERPHHAASSAPPEVAG
jgi:hypothetical protein